MRIAYLNPWQNAAENQAYKSLAIGATRVGLDLIHCRDASELEHSCAEFVVSVSSSVPKVIDIPSYLTVHEPKSRFLGNARYLHNLLSYDGYLTISDTLQRFVKDICFGAGRTDPVGFYYNAPQCSEYSADLERIVRDGALRLVYLGTNWDKRLPWLFRALDDLDLLRIHGPVASWRANYRSYFGPLPFDGDAPQRIYSECGMGLVLLSTDHLRENIISNRILEISSVGAVSVCPDIPWIREWFGESVLYFSPTASPRTIVKQICQHHQFCRENPSEVQQMALGARQIFEQHFCAERLLKNAVSYHEEQQGSKRLKRTLLGIEPSISVVIRCGGRAISMIKTAVDSIRRQTYGKFSIVLSKYVDVDLSPITSDKSGRVISFKEVLLPAGNRYKTLVAGLKAVDTEYFAILDDDDFWLSDHVESLFVGAQSAGQVFDTVFSGTVCIAEKGTEIETNLFWNRNIYTFGFRDVPRCIPDITSAFSSNCFVARTDLIVDGLENLPPLESAEESLIIALVTRRKQPIFSYKATAFFTHATDGGSNFASLSSRADDVLSLHLRSGLIFRPQWLSPSSTNEAMKAWDCYIGHRNGIESSFACLGLPEIGDDLMESWEILGKAVTGPAAIKDSRGQIIARKGQAGLICYGSLGHLPPNQYRIEIKIAFSRRRARKMLSLLKRRPLGSVNIVCARTQGEGAAAEIERYRPTTSVEFSVPRDLSGGSIEFRIFSSGREKMIVKSVRLCALIED